ncbi:cysteine synthase B [Ilumatobacter fluminis]|uniref:Cysteine synthase B n=2 Tax=Ilumatobacter fluminis TaxID=467091 RepID=A0A4R7I1S0_9ACTN|nr:cysteine synthase B [Ilumatobacter fluminis]
MTDMTTRPDAAGRAGAASRLGVGAMSGISSVHANVLDLIGNTPMVDVSNLSPNPNVRIIAKLEMQNPFGSVKDRIAKSMIEAAEADGSLLPGQTIIEPSSGNTGIALAGIARLKGYPIKILLPESVSIERRQMLEIMGAEIILTPGPEGSNGAVKRARQLAAEHPEWCFIYQYANEANPRAHYEGTGPEIWRDVPEITHFVAGLGTSGTLMGTGTFLKEQNPDVQVVAVEPPLGERVEGLRNMDEGYIPPVFDDWNGRELLDRKRVVRPRESIEWTRRLVNECGVFAGLSSGAALAGAAKVAAQIDQGTIVFVVCDGGWKYLSTGAYTGDLDAAEEAAEQIIYF